MSVHKKGILHALFMISITCSKSMFTERIAQCALVFASMRDQLIELDLNYRRFVESEKNL